MITTPDLRGALWRKSSRSQGAENCVEIAMAPQAAAVRDSKNPDGPVLLFVARPWSSFLVSLRTGALDS